MPRKRIEMVGRRFGDLLVLRDATVDPRSPRYVVSCLLCGRDKEMLGGNIRRAARKETRGCGCVQPNRVLPQFKKTHGLSGHRLASVWDGMMRRCFKEGHPAYQRYGGRGITVCAEWRESLLAFVSWCENNGWEPGLQLDRVDNDGNYEPGNVRFVSARENNNNRSNNRILSVRGERLTIAEASRKYGVGRTTIRERLNRGWSDADAVSPVVGSHA